MARDVVAEIRRATRRKFRAEDKIRIVLEGVRAEIPVSHLCRREGISPALYYQWSKAFLAAGKNGLTIDTKRDATKADMQRVREENEALKKALAETMLEVQRLKKSLGM
jgi:transposase